MMSFSHPYSEPDYGAPLRLALLCALACLACTSVAFGQAPPVAFSFDLQTIAAQDPQHLTYVEESPLGGPALRIQASEAMQPIRLAGPEAGVPWETARYFAADAYQENRHSDFLYLHFFDQMPTGATEPRISSKMGVLPKLATPIVLPLSYLDGQTFFMERAPRRLKGTMPGRRLPQENISAVTLEVGPIAEGFAPVVWISNIRLTEEEPSTTLPPTEPVVDNLGQWTARDWPGKARSVDDFRDRLLALHQQAQDATLPDSWSPYGGWKEKQFQATGYFRTQFDGERWWLVDPDGYAFFSTGIDVVTPYASGPYEGMEELFAWLPPQEGRYAEAYASPTGRPGEVSFLTTNLIRAFGENWRAQWRDLTRGLMRLWRFNTAGNWSTEFTQEARVPYVHPLQGFPTTDTLLYRDFPDVFSPEYRRASAEYARQLIPLRSDKYLIGYFLRNEPLWAFGANNVASEMLATDTPSHTRRALIDWLRTRYNDNIHRLSAAWARPFSTFDDLLNTPILDAEDLSPLAKEDLWTFSGLMVDEYLKQPSDALRRVDPYHMNLGIRYAWISSDLLYRGSVYFDVFSINSYTEQPPADEIAAITERTGLPVLIGEFHYGSIDRGLPSTGIGGAASQEERGVAYRYYVEQGAAIPSLVGMHYFQLNDQPVLGRFDGENYNIGLVDVTNLPYPETTQAARATNERIYEVAAGTIPPFSRRARQIPKIYF